MTSWFGQGNCTFWPHFGVIGQARKVPKGNIFGKSMGYSQFIPHSSLSYDSTSNVEYSQEDCLRFRVSM